MLSTTSRYILLLQRNFILKFSHCFSLQTVYTLPKEKDCSHPEVPFLAEPLVKRGIDRKIRPCCWCSSSVHIWQQQPVILCLNVLLPDPLHSACIERRIRSVVVTSLCQKCVQVHLSASVYSIFDVLQLLSTFQTKDGLVLSQKASNHTLETNTNTLHQLPAPSGPSPQGTPSNSILPSQNGCLITQSLTHSYCYLLPTFPYSRTQSIRSHRVPAARRCAL